MSNLKILLKNNLNMLLGRLQGKKKRKSTSVALCLLILGMIGIIALYTLQAWSMFQGLGSVGLGKVCVFHAVTTTLTVLLIIGIMRVTGKTKGNDADFLLSLPIKKRDIIISKVVNKYLFDLFFSFTMLIPYIVLYEITAEAFSPQILIFGIIAALFLPLLSVGISQIMEFIVVRLFNRIKGGAFLKSLIPTFIYILLLVLLLIKTSGYGTVQPESIEAYFQDRWLSNQILTFIFDQSLLSILVFAGITLIPCTIGILLYINIYGKNFGLYSNKKEKVELKDKQKPFSHLLNKEIKTYFLLPVYFVNTIIGPILMIVLSVVSCGYGFESIQAMIQLPLSSGDFQYVFVLLVNFCIASTCISCVSISLEGKSFWLLQTLPIPTNQIFLAKLFIPIMIVSPAILISAIFAGIMFQSVITTLVLFAIAFLFLLITDVSGLMINLWLPKLNWENETQVVKQSLSLLLSMIFNIIMAVIPIVIYLVFNTSILLTMMISLIIYVLLLIIFTCLLFTVGKKMFNKLKQ